MRQVFREAQRGQDCDSIFEPLTLASDVMAATEKCIESVYCIPSMINNHVTTSSFAMILDTRKPSEPHAFVLSRSSQDVTVSEAQHHHNDSGVSACEQNHSLRISRFIRASIRASRVLQGVALRPS